MLSAKSHLESFSRRTHFDAILCVIFRSSLKKGNVCYIKPLVGILKKETGKICANRTKIFSIYIVCFTHGRKHTGIYLKKKAYTRMYTVTFSTKPVTNT